MSIVRALHGKPGRRRRTVNLLCEDFGSIEGAWLTRFRYGDVVIESRFIPPAEAPDRFDYDRARFAHDNQVLKDHGFQYVDEE